MGKEEMGSTLMNDSNSNQEEPEVTTREVISQTILELNTNYDTQNSCNIIQQVPLMDIDAVLQETFTILDSNGDGVICEEDLKNLFTEMKEKHSKAAISYFIKKFNRGSNQNQVIDFQTFKEKVAFKIENTLSEEDLKATFQKVSDITDGIRIIDSDNKPQGEIIQIELVIKALDSNIISSLGKFDKGQAKVILGEMVASGLTYGLNFQEFCTNIEEYTRDPFVIFGALLTGGCADERNGCENDKDYVVSIVKTSDTESWEHKNVLTPSTSKTLKRKFDATSTTTNLIDIENDDDVNQLQD